MHRSWSQKVDEVPSSTLSASESGLSKEVIFGGAGVALTAAAGFYFAGYLEAGLRATENEKFVPTIS